MLTGVKLGERVEYLHILYTHIYTHTLITFFFGGFGSSLPVSRLSVASTWAVFSCRGPSGCPSARGTLVPRPEIESASPALEGRFFFTGPPEKFHSFYVRYVTWELPGGPEVRLGTDTTSYPAGSLLGERKPHQLHGAAKNKQKNPQKP